MSYAQTSGEYLVSVMGARYLFIVAADPPENGIDFQAGHAIIRWERL